MLRIRGLALALLVGSGSLPIAALPISAGDVPKWREDLRHMAVEMPRRHKNLFHSMTRAQFDGAVAVLDERIPSLQRHQIIVEMARIAAMVGDGHTNIAPTRDPKIGFRTYPIKLYLFQDGLYVRAAARERADLLGARVVRIGKASADEAYAAVRGIIGRDNEMDGKYFAPFLLAMPEVLHALGLIDDMERAAFTVEVRGRRKVVVLAPAGPADLLPPDTDTSWMPKDGWIDARGSPSSDPLWLRDPKNKFWFEYLPASRAVYVQFNHVGNKDTETVADFARRLFAFVAENPVDRFVLDLRLNRGGDGGLNRPLLLGIIKSDKIDRRGKLFTLIGRSTWSAAQMLVNELEEYTQTLFVGEPSGGKVNSYGDSRKITLPNSGITVRVSTLWWQGDERDKRPWMAPDIAADLTFDDYRANNDPALRVALDGTPPTLLADVLMETVSAADDSAAAEQYRRWKADPRNAYVDPEPELIDLGYRLMGLNRLPEAIQIFRIAAEASPLSANAHDSLGEAYLQHGDRELAIRSYERALTIDPRMDSSKAALEKLRALR
ncbi:MAG: tetratricopeptide repeat protein [Thermoanaerobaculia bacterium]